jgi:DNA-binding transcriptional LysR family regulator
MKAFTLDQLRALDAIEQTGSFASAGEKLHKVPSAISYAVQSLESVLDVALFDRSRRRAALTPAGHRVLSAARELLREAEVFDGVVSSLIQGWEPELHVVVDGALPMHGVIEAMKRFSDADVPTRLRLEVEYQEGVVERFERSGAQLGMALGFEGNRDDDGYDCVALAPLELVLVAASDHPMVTSDDPQSIRGNSAELVVRDTATVFDEQSKGSFMGSANVVFLSDFHSKRNAILAGAGYGWIPKHFIEQDLAEGKLVPLSFEPNNWVYHPQIITRKGIILGKAARLFQSIVSK